MGAILELILLGGATLAAGWMAWSATRAAWGTESTPVAKTPQGRLYHTLTTKGCPDCGSKNFAEGPSGGMSTNILSECGSEFNITPVLGIAERI